MVEKCLLPYILFLLRNPITLTMDMLPYICPDHQEYITSLRRLGLDVEADEWEKELSHLPHPSPLTHMRVFKMLVDKYFYNPYIVHLCNEDNSIKGCLIRIFSDARCLLVVPQNILYHCNSFLKGADPYGVFSELLEGDLKHEISSVIAQTYHLYGYVKVRGKYCYVDHPITLAMQGKIPLTRRTLGIQPDVKDPFPWVRKGNNYGHVELLISICHHYDLVNRVTAWTSQQFIFAILSEILIIEKREDLLSHLRRNNNPSFCRREVCWEMRKIFGRYLTFGNIFPKLLETNDVLTPDTVLPGLHLHYHDYNDPSSTILDDLIQTQQSFHNSGLPSWVTVWGLPNQNMDYYHHIYRAIVDRWTTERLSTGSLSSDIFPSATIRSYMRNRYGVDTSDISVETEILRKRREIASSLKEELEEACPDGAPHIIWSNPDSVCVKSFYSKPDATMDERLKDNAYLKLSLKCSPHNCTVSQTEIHRACVEASISGDYTEARKMVVESNTSESEFYPRLYYRGAVGLPLRDEHIQKQRSFYKECIIPDVTIAYYKGLLKYGPISMLHSNLDYYKNWDIDPFEVISILKHRSPDLLLEYQRLTLDALTDTI
jgi:hypothetical protein